MVINAAKVINGKMYFAICWENENDVGRGPPAKCPIALTVVAESAEEAGKKAWARSGEEGWPVYGRVFRLIKVMGDERGTVDIPKP